MKASYSCSFPIYPYISDLGLKWSSLLHSMRLQPVGSRGNRVRYHYRTTCPIGKVVHKDVTRS